MAPRCRRTRASARRRTRLTFASISIRAIARNGASTPASPSSNGLIIVAPGPYDANPMRQTYGSAEYTRGSASFTAMTSIHSAQLRRTADDRRRQHQQPVAAARCERQPGRPRAGTSWCMARSFKHSHFDLSFVPDVHHRDEAGAFVTDDLHLTDTVRAHCGSTARLVRHLRAVRLAAARHPVTNRRTGQTIRATYNRAYSAPSTVESYANFTSSIDIPLGATTFPVPITTVGNQDLGPQTIDAFEIGYNGCRQRAVSPSTPRSTTSGRKA